MGDHEIFLAVGCRPEGEYRQDVEDEVHRRIAEEEADGAAADQSAARSIRRMTTAAWRRTGHSSVGLCEEHTKTRQRCKHCHRSRWR